MVLYSPLVRDGQEKSVSLEREGRRVKQFQNKLGTTDVRFLSYNGIYLLSQQAVYESLGAALFQE